jgi:hypothetical protein
VNLTDESFCPCRLVAGDESAIVEANVGGIRTATPTNTMKWQFQ